MYLAFGLLLIVRHRAQLLRRMDDGFRAPYPVLEQQPVKGQAPAGAPAGS